MVRRQRLIWIREALVPDELTCDLVMDRITAGDCKNGFVIKTVSQEQFHRQRRLDDALTKIGRRWIMPSM